MFRWEAGVKQPKNYAGLSRIPPTQRIDCSLNIVPAVTDVNSCTVRELSPLAIRKFALLCCLRNAFRCVTQDKHVSWAFHRNTRQAMIGNLSLEFQINLI